MSTSGVVSLLTGLALLMQHAAAGEPPRARPPDHTGPFGEPLPEGALLRLGTLRFRTQGRPIFLAFTPDGKSLATRDFARPMRLLDVATGRGVDATRWQVPKEGRFITQSVSRDGRYLAWNTGRQIAIEDLRSAKHLRNLDNPQEWMRAVAFGPDSRTLVALRHDGTLQQWDATTGKQIHQQRLQLPVRKPAADASPDLGPACLSPDAAVLAAVVGWEKLPRENVIRLWDVATGKELRQLKGHDREPTGLDFSPDGRFLLSNGADGSLRLWETATGKQRHRFAKLCTNESISIAFSSDGKLLAVGGDEAPYNLLRICDLETGQERWRLPAPADAVAKMTFSLDGRQLAVVSGAGMVQLWDLTTGRLREGSARDPGVFERPLFSRDGAMLFVGNRDKGASAWELASRRQRRRLPGLYPQLLSDSGDILALGGIAAPPQTEDAVREKDIRNTFLLVDPQTGETRGALAVNGSEELLGLSPDSKRALVGQVWLMPEGRVVAVADGKEIHQPPLRRGVWMGWSADLKYIAGLYYGGSVRIFDGRTGKFVRRFDGLTGETISNPQVLFAPDGQTLAVKDGKQVVVWNVSTGAKLLHARKGPWLIGWSPDSKCLLIVPAPQEDVTPALVEIATGKVRRFFKELEARRAGQAVFSPDGKLLAGTAKDHAVQLWEVATGQPLRCFRGHQQAITRIVFAPNGRWLATASEDTTVIVWDVTGLSSSGRLAETRLSAAEFGALWEDLASADASRAQRAVWRLASDARQTPARLAKRLRPAPTAEPQQLARLLAELDSDEFARRRQAREQLAQMESARAALRQRLRDKPSLELRRQLEQLLEELADPAGHRERLRALRADAVLEQIASPEAEGLLRTLAHGAPEAHLTHDARAALQRLSRRAGKP